MTYCGFNFSWGITFRVFVGGVKPRNLVSREEDILP